LITFADLKKYKFFYWFAYPAIVPKKPFTFSNLAAVETVFSHVQQQTIRTRFHEFKSQNSDQAGFFLFKNETFARLQDWEEFWNDGDEITVGFVDPCSSPKYPGWPLRNLLQLIKYQWNLSQVRIFCYRENRSQQIIDSIFLTVFLHPESKEIFNEENISVVGWEKGPSGTPTPRLANLAPMMDPKQLANTAVDLNLKLMRWRILPSLNLESIAQTKCLLLGAGTLGCYVARMLMAWGVRTITMVDNGKVSFSNPVRQPLFNFEDCLDGGQPKAIAAAKSLINVFPGVNARGIELSVPMPGHTIDSKEKMMDRISMLESLIQTHDAIFLLMDSRESRWLPTVLGAYHEKVVSAQLDCHQHCFGL
jgi:ubiquitin-like modifier-activating enzyme ATG7